MDQRLTDIGVNMARQAAELGLDRIDVFAQTGEAEAVDDPLDGADLLVRPMPIGVRILEGIRMLGRGN